MTTCEQLLATFNTHKFEFAYFSEHATTCVMMMHSCCDLPCGGARDDDRARGGGVRDDGGVRDHGGVRDDGGARAHDGESPL